jgi:valyl-tRNA synthetase
MSKSKGNVVNPMEKIDQYGSDAFRLGVIAGQSAGNNQSYDENRLIAARNFCNKLWNIARFIEDKVGEDYKLKGSPKAETIADAWMLHKLQQSTEEVTVLLNEYRLSEAYELLYHLVWDDFADWYIEASKSHLNPGVLAYSLETILKLVHPFAPFVTETIWQTLKWENDSLLVTTAWPKPVTSKVADAQVFEQVKAIVTEVRYIKGAMHLRGGISLYHTGEQILEEQGDLIASLARLEKVAAVKDGHGLHLTSVPFSCWLDIDQETATHFVTELSSKIEEQQKVIKQLEGRLSNDSYVKNAPKAVVDQTRDQLKEAETQLTKLRAEHDRFAAN